MNLHIKDMRALGQLSELKGEYRVMFDQMYCARLHLSGLDKNVDWTR